MKITLNNLSEQNTIEFKLPSSVITDQIQPRLDLGLATYKEMPLQKRIMLKAAIRTGQAMAEQFAGIKIELPEADDYIIMLLENLPVWITSFMEKIEIDASTVNKDTKHQTVTRVSIKLTD